MKNLILAASAMTMIGGAAFAGGYTQPVVEAAPVAPAAAPQVANANWGGFYAGAQLGYGKPDGALDTDGAIGGAHLGYLLDNGSFVYGGELAYNAAHMDEGTAGKVKNFTDLKLIAGVPYGKFLTYGTVGASYAKADIAGVDHKDTLPMVGVGVKYALDNNWSVGTEVDYRKGDNFDDTDRDLNATTIEASVSYRF